MVFMTQSPGDHSYPARHTKRNLYEHQSVPKRAACRAALHHVCRLSSIEWMLWPGRHLCFCCDRRIAIHQAILTDTPAGMGSVGAAGREDLAARL